MFVCCSREFYSTDDWQSGRIIQEVFSAYPGGTTVVARNVASGVWNVYLVHAHLGDNSSVYEIESLHRYNDVGDDLYTITNNGTRPGISSGEYIIYYI